MNKNVSVLDQIKSKTRLSDYIGQFTIQPLKASGGEGKFLGLCPLHDNTKSPALSVDDNKGLWKCFTGCGGGSIVDFWLIQHGYDSRDRSAFGLAMEGLAGEFDIEVPEYKSDKKGISPTRIKKALDQICTAATDNLFDSEDAGPAYDYLIGRGFTDALIEKYRIGFIPSSNKSASKFIEKAVGGDDYSIRAAIGGGVLNRSSSNDDTWTPLFGRIVIPITDRFGSVLGFGAREVPNIPHYGEGKWINPGATDVYDKSKVLFDGGALSRENRPKKGVIVEGYFDVIAVNESEYDGIGFAVCGTSTTPQHIDMLNALDEITTMFDGDDAGMKATSKLTWVVNKREDVFSVILPKGVDPFDVVFGGESEHTITSLVETSQPLIKVAVDVERKQRTKNDEFDKWVAEAISVVSSDKMKNELAAAAASERGQNKSAYIRNLSRINIANIKHVDAEDSSIDVNAASLISFIMHLSDDEKDGLFHSLGDDEITLVMRNWLPLGSDIAFATATKAIFGESFLDSPDISDRDIDREIAALLLSEEDVVNIERPLLSAISLLSVHAKTIVSHPDTSEIFTDQMVMLRSLTTAASEPEKQAEVLSAVIDLSVDVADFLARRGQREDG